MFFCIQSRGTPVFRPHHSPLPGVATPSDEEEEDDGDGTTKPSTTDDTKTTTDATVTTSGTAETRQVNLS